MRWGKPIQEHVVHPWYAWHPVQLQDRTWAWDETVARLWVDDERGWLGLPKYRYRGWAEHCAAQMEATRKKEANTDEFSYQKAGGYFAAGRDQYGNVRMEQHNIYADVAEDIRRKQKMAEIAGILSNPPLVFMDEAAKIQESHWADAASWFAACPLKKVDSTCPVPPDTSAT